MATYKLDDTRKNSKGDYRLGKMKLGRDANVAGKWIAVINYLKLDPNQKSSKSVANALYEICKMLGMK